MMKILLLMHFLDQQLVVRTRGPKRVRVLLPEVVVAGSVAVVDTAGTVGSGHKVVGVACKDRGMRWGRVVGTLLSVWVRRERCGLECWGVGRSSSKTLECKQ